MLHDLPWKWIKIIILLLRLHPSISFCSVPFTVMTTPISSKGILFTVVDIVVIWFNSSIPVYFTSLIPKTSKFTFVTSCLTMSNLRWFRNLTFQVSMQYIFTASNFCFHQQIHLQLSVILLWSSHFILSGAISDCPLLLPTQCHFGHILTWGAHLPVSSFYLFILFMGFLKQEYWHGLPLPSPVDYIFLELSTMTHASWVALHGMVHSFIELYKAVIHMIILFSFLWLWLLFCSLWDRIPCFFCLLSDRGE